ncbi:MAG: hypothetical protein RH942_06545 [Kiloniellaceae bacterium]
MFGWQRNRFVGFILAVALVAGNVASPALAAISQEAAAQKIAESYGVEVLKVRAGERDSRKVWLVTVMFPGGNRNNAFQVHVLAVDQETGELVSSFQHRADGYSLPPPAPGAER